MQALLMLYEGFIKDLPARCSRDAKQILPLCDWLMQGLYIN
jgi:hypothetical protein